jgi:hypothetical protein
MEESEEEDELADGSRLDRLDLRDRAQRIANRVFQGLRTGCPRLMALGIDLRADEDGYQSKPTFAFLRGTHIDLYGNQKIVGLPIDGHMVKHHEPACSVLNAPGQHVF